jgi:signal peptidase I
MVQQESHTMSNSTPEIPPANPRRRDSWREIATTILYALLIAGGIRTAAAQPFNIPSGSMESTLLVGDYLFVSKPAYGYSRYSLPWGYALPLPQGRVLGAEPERGDVVVFKTPADNKTDYIKRVIGLPGDRIQMRDGVLHINGEPVPKIQIEPFMGEFGEVAQYRETLPNGVSYNVLDREAYGFYDSTEVFVVPEGHYFMMGDNRDNSLDSRAPVAAGGVGFVPFENLVGKAEILFFSFDDHSRWWEVWNWPSAIRYRRLAQPIG